MGVAIRRSQVGEPVALSYLATYRSPSMVPVTRTSPAASTATEPEAADGPQTSRCHRT
jgi:hypothetical protein